MKRRNTKTKQPVISILEDANPALCRISYVIGSCRKCSGILKTICALVLFFAGQIIGFAQTRIKVLDKENNAPVTYADVY
jgi:hypothetical protein